MSKIENIITEIIRKEGGYVNHPNDRGGPTKYGITEAVARANGYQGRMQDLPENLARTIYRTQYYNGPRFDAVERIAPQIAEELADTGVNMGVAVAARFLQQALNAFNGQGRYWPDISTDGYIGNATLAALRSFVDMRRMEGILVLNRALNCLQGARYIELTQSREKNEDFVYGWIKDRVGI